MDSVVIVRTPHILGHILTQPYRKWQQMRMPEWAHLEMEEIDFQVRILQATMAEFH